MKKIFLVAIAIITAFTLSGCTNDGNNDDLTLTEALSSEQSLATLSYLSVGFLDFTSPADASSQVAFLSAKDDNETVIEGELDEVNVYIDRLKALIDNGVEDFGTVNEDASDNELFEFKLTFTVEEEVYMIYYNIDADTAEMTGIIVIGDVEYEFEVLDNINQYEHNEENKPENVGKGKDVDKEDESDTEVDTEETDVDTEESETKMVLVATKDDDTIKIIYKSEVEEDESTIKFYVEQTIDGVYKEMSLRITNEEDGTKIKIADGDDEYTFKSSIEEDVTVYMLQYKVDDTKGMVRITEIVDEDGNITYDYFIQEAGRERHTQRQEPDSKGFDDDETEEESQDA